jgi:hypothetical protein
MSADTFNSQPFSPPRNGPEDQAISVCNRCQGRLEYESDKKQNGNWYKLCSVVLLRETIRDAEEKSGLQMSQISLTSLERCERYPPQSSHLDNA